MIVPPSVLPPTSGTGPLAQDNQPQKPSPALLLMAAAQMHQMGRLAHGRPSGPKAKAKGKALPPQPDDDGEAA